MAIDVQVIVTKDALQAVTINPPDLSTGAEEDMFLDYIWFSYDERGDRYAPVDAAGVPLTRNNANQATAIRNWTRHMLRMEYKKMVQRKKAMDAATAASAVVDFADKADA